MFEVDAVDMLDHLDDVAADFAATTIEQLFGDVDAEAVLATAFWTWAAAVDAAAKLDPAPLNLAFDRNGASFIRPRIEGVLWHDAPRQNGISSSMSPRGFPAAGSVAFDGGFSTSIGSTSTAVVLPFLKSISAAWTLTRCPTQRS